MPDHVLHCGPCALVLAVTGRHDVQDGKITKVRTKKTSEEGAIAIRRLRPYTSLGLQRV